MGTACIGIDVGGTFTDAVLADDGQVWRAKAATVPGDAERSVLDACELVATRAGTTLAELLPRVGRFGVGTTAVTNVLTARTGACVGLVTTAGFEDELPVAKGRRINDGVWSTYPEPVVPRDRIVGVHERIDRDGVVLVPLDLDEAVTAARGLVERHGVTSLAVSFLWSFRNPVHEEQAAGAIAAALPEVAVMSGAELQPTIREFERSAHAVLNAYAVTAFAGIDRLGDELSRRGLRVPVLLMHSGGGTTTIPEARRTPLLLAASGPAAGVAAAIATTSTPGGIVTCDMGGTSFDVSVATGGRVPRRNRAEVAGLLTSLSMVDIESIGAGGGSVGWVDARGMLRVGPRSAGSQPGPACYGRGGTEATVTDALVVLGHLDADRFLGGEMRLDVDAARSACARLGAQVGLDADECAWGIRRLALEGMTTAVRSLLDARGLAPADHCIVSYGGCGALFTPDIAAALGIGKVAVPELSAVLSAFGAASADIRRERVRSLALALPTDIEALAKVAAELRDAVLADLGADGLEPEARSVHFEADLRFKRQVWELTIPLPGERIDGVALDRLVDDFQADYARRYGAGSLMLGAAVELVTLRAVGTGRTVQPATASARRKGVRAGTAPTPTGSRRVRVERGARGWRKVAVHDGAALRPGHVVAGPALVDERDTTVWVPTGATLAVDRAGTLTLDLTAARAASATARSRTDAGDPIALELLRAQLQAVAEEAASAIERTAISPVVTESKDYSATLLDARGDLVAGGGVITYHWVAATRAVRATIARFGDAIEPGDVFLANDPYNGGGLHPNDVFVQRPVFVDGRIVAWAALSAHLIDMGGMAMGSFAPAATDCFQEALRIPPVRILRRGEEVSDVWDIFRTNVRLSVLVEMDLRGLVAGANVANAKLVDLATNVGVPRFTAGMRELQALSEREFRRRIARIADGTYRATDWVEWDEELHEIPCTLTVAGDELTFDFAGTAPQAPHFFNSKPYIIKSGFMWQCAWLLASDLPYSEGLLAPVELLCPEGTIVNSVPPAPINAGHIHVAFTASELMMQTLRMALWASPDADPGSPVVGLAGNSALALSTWSALGLDGVPDTWMLMDGAWVGSSAGDDRDGQDMAVTSVGAPTPAQYPDIEILESWYPMLIVDRSVRPGAGGAGRHRAGGGSSITLRPHGTDRLVGQMLGMRAYVPLIGAGGGRPGATTVFTRRRVDGGGDLVSAAAASVVVEAGESFEIRCASGGGVGDPLERAVAAVAHDVAGGRITTAEADAEYGVVLGPDGALDDRASARRRAAIRKARLRAATPARRPVAEAAPAPSPSDPPLAPGVVQRGRCAVAEASGAVLAVAPDHWTDGCPVLETAVPAPGPGPAIVARTYLDPRTGAALHTEVAPAGSPRSFESRPTRWR